jgi:DNA-binding response OmpR family regulator
MAAMNSTTKPKPARKRILIVEDDVTLRALLGEIMREAGFEVLTAEHALAAVFAMVRAGADLVLTDIRMPIVDGLRLVRELKSHADTCHVPVLAMTGWDTPESRAAAREAGCAGYIVKPIDFDKLLSQVAGILGTGK